MLVKYYGLIFDKEANDWSPRAEFISNGLFRMTQPKYLNDKGSEARLWPYFNNFSPADYAWAKREHDKIQLDPSHIPSNEELESFFLKPRGLRYGDQFPHMLHQEGFKSMDEYDQLQLTKIAEGINNFIVEALSCHLGILSLSKSDTNEIMWTHYASEGKGLAVTFKQNHPFFNQFPPKDVSYATDKRVSLTYYKGVMRINGAPLKKFNVHDFSNPLNIMQSLSENGIDIDDFTERLLYSKAEKWAVEDEVRIVCPLAFCENKKGSLVRPDFEFELTSEQSVLFNAYSEINLKKIPFDAFDSIVFGYSMSESDMAAVIGLVRENDELSHIKLRVAKHNIYGNVEIFDLVEK
ncbi:DUF2971 domain-containing protein [Klebsiella pneumoniae]|uniref:DUF2971 domain-containing protein n=1 Tax=Klebsiella pneumoniae TaxID=573 RepID=UPI000B95A3F9|nr:DUF2971 domain-containing protein [Klebsiella pneumoniae]MEA4530278.1 DUF2971 domain-containing protein [Klebsiella pneumoniae]OYI97868.1 hypothetical protein CI683_02015 [Klebsiella pneumoniae subsp. pneumoniae]OYJ00032.1 hypothetical protein CI682_27740 [Klebsiella pneumoniae subsp. pneumoniae]PLL49088.1 DUF2971 domain-containing protein [Klebsiella pneumoniae]SXQ06971.1 Protein of uncharacterised function (DUF2971) [Klebsiella pneumoniae]